MAEAESRHVAALNRRLSSERTCSGEREEEEEAVVEEEEDG